jgi:hypothetical protein
VALSRPPPADLPVVHGSESELHGPSKRSKNQLLEVPAREGEKGRGKTTGQLRGGLHLVFLDFGLGGRERRARPLLLGVVPHLLLKRRLRDTIHGGNQHRCSRHSNRMKREGTRRELTGGRKEEAMAGWKYPWGRGAWREWCRRQDMEKGAVKEGNLGIRGWGSGRAWDATAAAEDERTRRPRPPAAHHHRRIDLHLSLFQCVSLAGLGFVHFAMLC